MITQDMTHDNKNGKVGRGRISSSIVGAFYVYINTPEFLLFFLEISANLSLPSLKPVF